MKYFELEVIDYFEKKPRGENPKTLPYAKDENKIDQLYGKEIENIKVSAVNLNTGVVMIRVNFHADGELVRHDFTNNDINKSITRALKYVDEIKECTGITEVTITESVKEYIKGEEVYKYQNKIDNLLGLNIRLVTGHPHYYKSHDNYIYLLLVYVEKGPTKRVSFGGKTQSIKESYKIAKKFTKILKKNYEGEFKTELEKIK